MLKNLGMLCAGCSGGHHEDCSEVNEHEHDKHMCVCYWSVGPEYHQRMKRESTLNRIPVPIIGVGVIRNEVKPLSERQTPKLGVRSSPS